MFYVFNCRGFLVETATDCRTAEDRATDLGGYCLEEWDRRYDETQEDFKQIDEWNRRISQTKT